MPTASLSFSSLLGGIKAVLECQEADEKAALARIVAHEWQSASLPLRQEGENILIPSSPGRPARPVLLSHRDMPKRGFKGPKGRFALLHALAHIEFNAIDLAFDIAGRFMDEDLPRDFFDDWIAVGDDEARHFNLINSRLRELGGEYGDMPAHGGLWEAAEETGHSLLARLAIVPLVLEARGLDVTPVMMERLTAAGDHESAALLTIIYEDEKQHVAVGSRWFNYICTIENKRPDTTFHALVRRHFRGPLKPPFNREARDHAGLEPEFYEPLVNR